MVSPNSEMAGLLNQIAGQVRCRVRTDSALFFYSRALTRPLIPCVAVFLARFVRVSFSLVLSSSLFRSHSPYPCAILLLCFSYRDSAALFLCMMLYIPIMSRLRCGIV